MINEQFSDIGIPIDISPEQIKIQLQKISESDALKSKRVLCKLLNYITMETLEGRRDKLKGYTIGLAVFNKDCDFDADQDALVRINAGRLRRNLSNYYSNEGMNDEIIIEIPKGGYAPEFSSNKTQTSQTISTKRKNPIMVPSIAILPFKNQTGDSNKDYFVQGFAEELSAELTNYEDLIIYDFRQRLNNVFTQANTDNYIKENNIRFLLNGSIYFDEKIVKALVKVTTVIGGEQFWAHSYTKEFDVNNIHKIQEDIAHKVALSIGGELGIICNKLTLNTDLIQVDKIETYQAVLQYYKFNQELSQESAINAFTALSNAFISDPHSGVLAAYLATVHSNSYFLDAPIYENSFQLFCKLTDQAYKLDPNKDIVQTAMVTKHFALGNKDAFHHAFEKCMKSNPKGVLRLGSLAVFSALYGNWEKGIVIIKKLMHENLNFPIYFYGFLSLYYYRRKEYKQALIEAKKYILPAGPFWAPLHRVVALGQLNMKDEAIPEIAELMRVKPDFNVKAPFIMGLYIKEEDLVEHMMDGLRKAGMKV